jgi:hypothetical protein
VTARLCLALVGQPVAPRLDDALEVGVRARARVACDVDHDLARLVHLDQLVEELANEIGERARRRKREL